MFTTDVSDQLRFAVDALASTGSYIGLHRYKCYLTKIVTTVNNGLDNPGSRTRTDTRIVLGDNVFFQDGYSIDYPGDGYLNPPLRYVSNQEIALSGNRLNNKCMEMKITYPYSFDSISGGIDQKIFDPDAVEKNTQIFIRVFGPGFHSTSGAYFKILYTEQSRSLSYSVYLENTATVIP